MQWWNDFVHWFYSDEGTAMTYAAVVLAVAVIISGAIGALIGRSGARSLLRRQEADRKASAIAALVDAATEASVWNSLTPQEQVLSDRAVGQADIIVRLLPARGAREAANWASHQLADLKRNSATFGYQLDPAVAEFRERLVEWQRRPSRARKSFQADLDRWSYELSNDQRAAVQRQDAWVADQHHQRHAGRTDTEAIPQTASPAPSGPAQNAPQGPATGASNDGVDPDTQRLMDDVDRLGPTP